MTTEDYQALRGNIPINPGIYKFLDETDTILYVGKAKNIRKRVASYFGDKKNMPYKTRSLVRHAHHMDFTIVETEQDALLLENTLIKKFQPRYNVMLKDGKSYTYLCIKKERFPRVFFTRHFVKNGSTYFGPYTSKYRTKIILELIKSLFPLRTCSLHLSQENIEKEKFKVCLEYHIKNCLGPCVNLETEESYNLKIDQIKNILRGNFKPVKDYIHQQMEINSKKLDFEKAHELKEKLSVFEDYQAKSTVVSNTISDVDVFAFHADQKHAYVNYLKVVNGALINTDLLEMQMNLNTEKKGLLSIAISKIRQKFNSGAEEIVVPFKIPLVQDHIKQTVPKIGDKRKLLDLSEKNLNFYLLQKRKNEVSQTKTTSTERILKTLQSDLQMEEVPFHIECFDNSNMQGTNPVASCVVFKNAKPSKRDYRHFKIKTVEGPDDFASMEEVVYRRYRRLKEEGDDLPQLIIIDGGKGQLNAAVKSLEKLDLDGKIIIIGIAKRLEEIFFPGDSVPLYINKKSESLKLIQHARNEAHRFAINFHRDLRSKDLIKTRLTEINGIGEKTAEKLLRHFGSIAKIKTANPEELKQVAGKSTFKKLVNYFANNN
jgi:excinuclease ABC subunit C